MEEGTPSEPQSPGAVELRYPPVSIAGRVAMAVLLSVGATGLLAAFLQVALLQVAARIGGATLLAVWLLAIALFAGIVWWQSKTFALRADGEGIHLAAGREQTTIRWNDIAVAEAVEPSQAGGKEAIEGLYVVLRDQAGRQLLSLAYDIRRGLPADQVTAFKRCVRAQLNAHHVSKEGPPLAWINWG